jgi:rhodanese-related sulfurtransferase
MTRQINRVELEALLDTGAVVLVDALPSSYYDQEHLPGALNLVEAEVADLAPTLLPDLNATIVTYCSNTACGNSSAVAKRLEDLGYADVRTYAAGIADWVEAGNPTESTVAA